MEIHYKLFKAIFTLVAGGMLTSCASYFYQPLKESEARLGAVTTQHKLLTSLPEPKEKVVAAVYSFRDQTGQYKPSETGAGWSTAVTQGATSILVRAMEDSRWFIPIEREGLSNLLNERKIIRSTRSNYAKATGRPEEGLPPLLYAGVILEGGIISYESNLLTGGAGLRYFGTGGGGQYRQDKVTVYLRAVSTLNGKVLKTVYTSKKILSQKVDGSLFRFVDLNRLLEIETGYTYNEPSDLAVTAAIEKAVHSLVIEGVDEGLWSLEDESEKTALVNQYKREKVENEVTDQLGRKKSIRRGKLNLGVQGGTVLYAGDYVNPAFRAAKSFTIGYGDKFWGAGLRMSQGKLATEGLYISTYNAIDLDVTYRLMPYDRVTPFMSVGTGLIKNTNSNNLNVSTEYLPKTTSGLGLEVMVSSQLGLSALIQHHYVFSDQLDGNIQGRMNDFFWSGRLGINLYLFGEGRKIMSKDKGPKRMH